MSSDAAEGAPGDFGLYVHWPFCEAKCPYCDFNSHVRRAVDHDRWAAAFEREIARIRDLAPDRILGSIFFGGGTPSLMSPDLVHRVIEAARRAWRWRNDIEITLEANPSSVEVARFRGFVRAGVNRISIGVQALNDLDLKRLGRLHSAAEALAAIETARAVTDRVSFDLIYARQDQTAGDWQDELKRALSMEPKHLSLYQLTIEANTAFGDRYKAGKLRGLPDEDRSAEMFETTQALCDAAGLPAYEISNHARVGTEGRHNLVYWRYGEYAGVGPGAHGRLMWQGKRYATHAIPSPEEWLKSAENTGALHETRTELSAEEQGDEYLMMSLRLREGASLSRFQALSGSNMPEARIARLMNDGLLWQEGDRIGTTDRGRLLLNAVLRELL
ncbi:radical SAM family heme chaperone HemW [Pararhodobacter sp. SW119]|uniref:radical SAM family heme chaperone HemW n=1 Tax=Pararhodobacter sp. SW119 TaxID=2780075 RepID=UPI001ADFF7CF|nr:radical SAM family heme chaperone HemW [Pararhodobacter sp. SW119]